MLLSKIYITFCFDFINSCRSTTFLLAIIHFTSAMTSNTAAVCPCFVLVFSSPPTKAVASSPLTLYVCFAVFLLSLRLSLVWTLRLIIQRKFKNLLFHILHIILCIDECMWNILTCARKIQIRKNFTLFLLSSSANLGHNT